ncbi:CdaR family transcriptional regulator, partial [Conexibacter sp. CPCC 205762]
PRPAGAAPRPPAAAPRPPAPAASANGAAAHEAGGGQVSVPDPIRVRLAAAAEHVRRGLAPHHLLVRVGGERVVCVLACQNAAELAKRAQALAAAAAANLADAPGWAPLVGAGEARPAAAELALAYAQARTALRVGRAVGGFGAVVAWEALGAYRTLAALLPEGAAPPPNTALDRLLASSEASTLVPTLACYLDLGGDARAAAEQLFLHRSSLYGRLHRIEEVAQVDLRSGEDRLQLHMALRLRRLAGQG